MPILTGGWPGQQRFSLRARTICHLCYPENVRSLYSRAINKTRSQANLKARNGVLEVWVNATMWSDEEALN